MHIRTWKNRWSSSFKRIPELKKIQPAADQEALPGILEKIAGNVDSFFPKCREPNCARKDNSGKTERPGPGQASERVQDNYLILRHDNDTGDDMVEYRMDAAGHRMDQIGLDKGYLVTSGFALSCKYFSTDFQREAKFRYLGEQKIGLRDTFVVASRAGSPDWPLCLLRWPGEGTQACVC